MTPEQYGELRQSLGRIEGGVSALNEKVEKLDDRADNHSSRIRSLESSRKWAAGVLAGVAVIAKILKVV